MELESKKERVLLRNREIEEERQRKYFEKLQEKDTKIKEKQDKKMIDIKLK